MVTRIPNFRGVTNPSPQNHQGGRDLSADVTEPQGRDQVTVDHRSEGGGWRTEPWIVILSRVILWRSSAEERASPGGGPPQRVPHHPHHPPLMRPSGGLQGHQRPGGVVVIRTIRSRGADGWAARSPQHMGVAGGEGQASAGIRRHPQAAEVCRGDGHGPRLRMGVEAPGGGQGGRGGGQGVGGREAQSGGSGAQDGRQGGRQWS